MPSRAVITISGIAIGLIALFALITQGGYQLTAPEVPPTEDTDANGSAYLKEFLEEIGVRTAVSASVPQPPDESTLVILRHDPGSLPDTLLEAFAAQGGRLIVAPAFNTTEFPGPIRSVPIDPGEIISVDEFGGGTLGYTTGTGLVPVNDATIRPLATVGDTAVMALHRYGQGEIIAISDPVLLQNLVVQEDAAAVLFGRLFLDRPEDRVVFYHNATMIQRDVNNPIGIFTTPRFLPFTLHVLVVLGLFAWMAAVRFGAPERERAGKHRSISTHIDQVAQFFRRHGTPESIDLIHADWATHELRDRLHLPRHTGSREVAEHTAAVCGEPMNDIWELLEERGGLAENLIRERRLARERIISKLAEVQRGAN